MKQPDDFKNWIKRQVEDNPQEPPEEVWDQITENLDLETVWQDINQDLDIDHLWSTIDKRLQAYEQLLWWERTSGIMASAVLSLLVLLPFLWQPQQSDAVLASQEQPQSISSSASETPPADSGFDIENSAAPAAQTSTSVTETVSGSRQQENAAQLHSPDHPDIAKGHKSTAADSKLVSQGQKAARPETTVSRQTRKVAVPGFNDATALLHAKNRPSSIPPDHSPASGDALHKLRIKAPVYHLETEEQMIVAKAENAYRNWRLGLGASARMSWLLSQKTYNAMEKSSLTTSRAAYRNSLSLLAEKQLNPRISVYGDLALFSETGQRYEEYMNGIYGTTDTRLRYSHLNLLLSYNPKGAAALSRAHMRWLGGGERRLAAQRHTYRPTGRNYHYSRV